MASLSSGYQPQTNGQMEQANQELESTLQRVTERDPSSWSSYLPWTEYAHYRYVTNYGLPEFPTSSLSRKRKSLFPLCRLTYVGVTEYGKPHGPL